MIDSMDIMTGAAQNMSSLEKLTSGCSPFFFTSAASSAWFGELGRVAQFENTQDSLELKKQLNEKRKQFEDEKFAAELGYMRKKLELGRQHQVIATEKMINNRKQLVNFNHFLTKCWNPVLNLDIATVWDYAKRNKTIVERNEIVPLRVILSRPNTAEGRTSDNDKMDDLLSENAKELGNIDVLKYAWKPVNDNFGGMARSMNIHYIMQGIPTLIIIPHLVEDALHFEASMWSFGGGLGSFSHRFLFSMPYNENDYAAVLKEKIETVQFAIMGVVRDAYITMEFQRPATLSGFMDKIQQYDDIQAFVFDEYRSMQRQIESNKKLHMLCSESELKEMNDSLLPITELLTAKNL